MNPPDPSDLPVRLALQVDAVCARFEAAWQATLDGGERPRLVTYLTEVDEPVRPILVQELLRVEAHYRRRAGDDPRPADYETSLPGLDPAHLATALAVGPTPPETYSPVRPGIFDGALPPADLPSVTGYEILDELGSGGMGVVYKARQLRLNRLVALKMILAGGLAKPRELERFRREAEAVAQLQHPNIVQIYEIGEHARRPFLALEYVDGVSLDERFAGFPQPARAAAQLVETLARAMHYAHERGIVHRDLKPANVLLAGGRRPTTANRAERAKSASLLATSQALIPKITDFGLAKLIDSDAAGPTRSGDVLGTPSYMAPEQAAGKPGATGPATDVYGLGTILYELLTGHPPFRAESALDTLLLVRSAEPVAPTRLQPKCPRDLETIGLKCLGKDPARRYPTAQALADDLKRFLEGEPILARPVGTLERARKWVRRRPAVAALMLAIVAVATMGFVGVISQWRKATLALADSQRAHDATKAHLYLNQIALARHELLANHVGLAEHLLDDTPAAAHGWEWRYLKRMCQTNLYTLPGNGSPVQSVVYSPDGQLLASGSGDWYSGRDGELKVWDAQTGQFLRTLTHDIGTVYSLAFHRESERLASASADGHVRLWNARTSQLLRVLPGHTDKVACVAFSPDGRLLASAGWDRTVRLWDVETGRPLHRLTDHAASIWGLAFSPDGRHLVSSDRAGVAYLWEPTGGPPVRSFRGFDDLRAVAFHPDGTWLAFACYSGRLVQYDLTRPASDPPLVHHPNAGPLLSLVFTPNGSMAWSSREGDVRVQDPVSGKDRYVIRGHDGWAYTVAISPDGRRLASAGSDGVVRICDATIPEEDARYVTDGAELPGLTYDATGRLLALGAVHEATMTVWDGVTGATVYNLAGQANVTAAAASPDGHFRAWVIGGKTLRVHDPAKPAEVWSRDLGTGSVTGLAYSADSRRLAWGGADGYTRLCDAAGKEGIGRFGPHDSPVTGVAFDPHDTDVLATVGQDGTFRLWSIASGARIAKFGEQAPATETDRPKPAVTRIAFSPDGRRLAAANPWRPLEVWDVAAGRVALILDWDAEGASSAAWSADGNCLAAALGKRVKIWNAAEQSLDDRRRATAGNAVSWHRTELAWARQRRDWYAADYHVGKIIESEPTRTALFVERAAIHAQRAEAGRGRWEDVAADLDTAVGRDPTNLDWWYQQALAALALGDRDRYRTVCTGVLARFGSTADPGIANSAAWVCSLAPGGVDDPTRALELAEKSLAERPGNADFLNTVGAMLYRAGRFDEARQRFEDCQKVRNGIGDVWDWLFLAMIHQRLGHAEEARRWLDQALRIVDQTTPEQLLPGRLAPIPWTQRLELKLLRREAVGLVGGS